uniref:Uncharacterized protein n=1 Tax=Molossus molossus TaxID=27622 RepID=A0A7J8I9F2_MOLMO|nr:hypothetical protein HJG59_010674 [Molossus molossus]
MEGRGAEAEAPLSGPEVCPEGSRALPGGGAAGSWLIGCPGPLSCCLSQIKLPKCPSAEPLALPTQTSGPVPGHLRAHFPGANTRGGQVAASGGQNPCGGARLEDKLPCPEPAALPQGGCPAAGPAPLPILSARLVLPDGSLL